MSTCATSDPTTTRTTATAAPATAHHAASGGPLADLVRAAAATPLCDRATWDDLAGRARTLTVALACDGAVPGHLVVGPHDPPVLVTRLLAASWRHLTVTPARVG